MIPFYVINFDGAFELYDIMLYFKEVYKKKEKKPQTREEIRKFIEDESMYQFRARTETEYDMILIDLPCK